MNIYSCHQSDKKMKNSKKGKYVKAATIITKVYELNEEVLCMFVGNSILNYLLWDLLNRYGICFCKKKLFKYTQN